MTPLSAKALAGRLTQGETTAVRLAEEALGRIAETNERWRIFIAWSAEAALQAAAESDARHARQATLGPLDGIPFAVKDNLDAAGFVTTDGAQAVTPPAQRDSTVVARLKAAGAVLIGKLNMHEGALGATTDNPVWGRCENPALLGHTPGGSSGGSAAAIAGGIVPITLGTDTLGSVRIPAAYGGLWSLKPTFGLLPRTGLSMLSETLDTIGPLATSAADLALVLAATAGFDARDADSVAPTPGWDAPSGIERLQGWSFAVPMTILRETCEPAILDSFQQFVAAARAAGAAVREIVIPGWNPPAARRAGLLVLEAEASVRLGGSIDRGDSPYSAGFQSLIAFGRNASAEKVAAARRTVAGLRAAVLHALSEADAIVMPTAPQEPFAHGAAAPVSQADLTALASLAGCPAVTLPHGFGQVRPAASVQIAGAPFSEVRLLHLAGLLGNLT